MASPTPTPPPPQPTMEDPLAVLTAQLDERVAAINLRLDQAQAAVEGVRTRVGQLHEMLGVAMTPPPDEPVDEAIIRHSSTVGCAAELTQSVEFLIQLLAPIPAMIPRIAAPHERVTGPIGSVEARVAGTAPQPEPHP